MRYPQRKTLYGRSALAVCAALLFAAWNAGAAGPANLPAFSLPDLDGSSHSAAEFKGKVVVVDFWATWCAACKETVPKLTELQKKYGDRGLIVVGISVDKGSDRKVRKTAERLGAEYLILRDPHNALAKDFGFSGIPSLYIFDRTGALVQALPGYDADQEADLTQAALRALETAAQGG